MKMRFFKSKKVVYFLLIVIFLLEISVVELFYTKIKDSNLDLISSVSILCASFLGIDKIFGFIANPLIRNVDKDKEGAK